ncbi:barstar family protein [Streptomyces sp. NPDC001739]
MDGRHIVDEDSFYCALGEAINGPGGYFGWNLDAVDDCLRGRWGATPPFTLEWQHSTDARAHLALLLEIFEERGIEVILK